MPASTMTVETAGRHVTISGLPRRERLPLGLLGHVGDSEREGRQDTLGVRVLGRAPRALTDREWVPITRGVARDLSGRRILIDSVGGSGFCQLWDRSDGWDITSWWRPSAKERVAAWALPARRRLLAAQILLHYPALVASVAEGWAPLHVSLLEVSGARVVLAGPGGVGKSTLVAGALAAGAPAWCDNVAVSDGSTCFGLRESMRLPAELVAGGVSGRSTSHGRVEVSAGFLAGPAEPDVIVVVKRGPGVDPVVRPCPAENAVRALVAGTFAAGELMRLWPLVAPFSVAWPDIPPVPAVEDIARSLTATRPCFELVLGERRGVPLEDLLAPALTARTVVRS